MRIAYVSTHDPRSIRSWSGTVYNMAQALREQGIELELIGPLKTPTPRLYRFAKKATRMLTGRHFHMEREPRVLQAYADQVERQLATLDVDAIFSPGILPIAHLRTPLPIYTWTDCTFASIGEIYADYRNALDRSRRLADLAEKRVLSAARHAFFTSQWAADSAIADYGTKPAKVSVVPLGANFNEHFTEPSAAEAAACISGRTETVCRLLFVGVRWEAKGGPMAVRIAEQLQQQRIPVELHVVGCTPTETLPEFVTVHGFLGKNDPASAARLRDLYARCQFFVMPTTDDCFGIVYAEAAAFAMPSFGTRVGGVPSAVREGGNGYTFALDADPAEYAAIIAALFRDRSRYEREARGARTEFETRLNWRAAGKAVADTLKATIAP